MHDIWAPFAKQPAEESAESEDDSGATSSGASEAQAEAAAAQKARLDWAQEFVTKRGPATAKVRPLLHLLPLYYARQNAGVCQLLVQRVLPR